MSFPYRLPKYLFSSLFPECEYRTLFTSFRWLSNAQITKIDQSIIEWSYLEDIKILCNFVFYVVLFLWGLESVLETEKWKIEREIAFCLRKKQEKKKTWKREGKLIIDCHPLLPVIMLDASFISSCLIITTTLRHIFIASISQIRKQAQKGYITCTRHTTSSHRAGIWVLFSHVQKGIDDKVQTEA